MEKKFTIGYISHNDDVFKKFLGKSISELPGDFDVIATSVENYPAHNYNDILEKAQTPYVILTHQDISFTPDLLLSIEKTIDELGGDFGALGLVGVNHSGEYKWSSSEKINEVETLDCCFIVVKRCTQARFDTEKFGEYHLYVEDFCAQLGRTHNEKIYTILTDHEGDKESHLSHHSVTWNERGPCWGRYNEFKEVLLHKWPNLKTT
jgi:hypothetical protein